MDCNKFLENIVPYLDHEISQTNKESFDQHLNSCSSCHTLFSEVSATYKIIDIEKEIPYNPFFYHTLKRKLAPSQRAKTYSLFMQVLKPLAVAASIALGIIIGNGELTILGNQEEDLELAAESISLAIPADYSVWTTIKEDNGNEN